MAQVTALVKIIRMKGEEKLCDQHNGDCLGRETKLANRGDAAHYEK